jgi:hypothetical protein
MPAGLLASTESKRAMLRPMPIPIVSEIEPETYDMIPSTPTVRLVLSFLEMLMCFVLTFMIAPGC